MAVQGFGAGDFANLAKFAWKIYSNVRESRTNFGKLNVDVECLLVSIGSLDKGHTQELIELYIDEDDGETRQTEVRALRDGLNSVVMPFYALFDNSIRAFKNTDRGFGLNQSNRDNVAMFVDGPSTDLNASKERPWRKWAATSWIQRLIVAFELKDLTELRSRFAVQAANLNLFMTRLTHTQIHRQTELLTLNLAEQSLLRDNFRYSLDLSEAERAFRQDVASYVRFLLDGGKAFTDSELQVRKAATTYIESDRKKAKRRAKARRGGSDSSDAESELIRLRAEAIRMREATGGKARLQRQEEILLDDDARLKLAAARQRLALANIRDEPALELEASFDHYQIPERPMFKMRSKSEQILIPDTRRQKEPGKRPAAFRCDICERSIQAEKAFYRCESGRCGEDEDDTFDVCRKCYMDGENCPGVDDGICSEMQKVVWRGD